MPCKVKNHQYRETCGESDNRNSKHACVVEAHESTRKRLERTLPKDHDDRIAGNRFNSLSRSNLAHKFIPVHQAMKIPGAKAAVDKELEKLEKMSASQVANVRSNREVSQEEQKEPPFCFADGHLSSQECGNGPEVSKVQRPGCTPK